ncbi:pyruvate synthase subunit beta [Candidatus Bathyarchaeota archaeon]|nr:pyruvate synthase subunit beta [Candidatus Bathyarchaeota archaeon]
MSVMSLPKEEFMLAGTAACPGCGLTLALRHVLKALGSRTILVVPAGCTSVIQGIAPNSSFAVPTLNIAFAASAAAASGIASGLDVKGVTDVNVAVWAGDGGTADIGIQALSGAAERMTDMIYFCCDNESYMNTGIQRSSSTPAGAWTTTTPTGKREPKKDMPLIMAAHKIPYIATACSSYPIDLYSKVERAKKIKGTRYIHILSPCPTGWRYPSEKTVKIGRLAVETGLWPLYEIRDGRFTLSTQSKPLMDKSKRKPVKDYLEIQGRFSHLTAAEIENIQGMVSEMWDRLSLMDNRDLFQGW